MTDAPSTVFTASSAVQGIDVSEWQAAVDWPRVAAAGKKFAMLRASYGSAGVDKQFTRNRVQAPAAGILCGAYHYCYARSAEEARQEARHFLSVIQGTALPYPAALDMEDSSLANLGKQTLTDIVLTFLQTVQSAGYYVCLYTNPNWYVNYLDSARLKDFDLWLAQWSNAPTLNANFGLWQYSSTGAVPGIAGNVDLDQALRDYPAIIRAAGLNGFSQQGQPQPQPTPDPPQSQQTYTVQKGDTLSGIAARFGKTLNALLQANPQITNPSLIYPGQTVIIPGDGSSGQPSGQNPPATQSYTVQSGDTLSGIAAKLGVSLSALLQANPQIANPSLIYPGQAINLPQAAGQQARRYTVQVGDTFSGIAAKFRLSQAALEKANPQITNPNLIYPGQTLTIPG